MKNLKNLLLEQEYVIYKGLMRVTFVDSSTVMEIADVIRAVKGVTIVNPAGSDEENSVAMYDVKLRTNTKPMEAYNFVRRESLKSPLITKFEIGTKTIERV